MSEQKMLKKRVTISVEHPTFDGVEIQAIIMRNGQPVQVIPDEAFLLVKDEEAS